MASSALGGGRHSSRGGRLMMNMHKLKVMSGDGTTYFLLDTGVDVADDNISCGG